MSRDDDRPTGPPLSSRLHRHPAACAALLSMAVVLALVGPNPSGAQQSPPTGSYVIADTWDSSSAEFPAGLWAEPAGLDVMPSGRFVVSDAQLGRVEVREADGTAATLFGTTLETPAHVAADEARDRIYVIDAGQSAVGVFTLDGTPITTWPIGGGPIGVAVAADDGRVVVSDTAGDVVRWFEPDGTAAAEWGGSGAGPGRLDSPAGLHVSDDGRVYVADRGNRRVVVFNADGGSAMTINTDTGDLSGTEPLDVHVDGDHLWVASAAGLGRFDLGSRRITGFLGGMTARAVSGNSAHGLLAAVIPGVGEAGVWRYRHRQSSGEPLSRLGDPLTVPGYLDGPEAVAVGANGYAYIVDVPPRFQRFALSGAPQMQIIGPDVVQVAVDASSRIFAVDEGGTIHAFAADSSSLWSTRIRATGVQSSDMEPVALAWDALAAEVLAVEAVSGRVYRFDDAGAGLGSWSPSGAGGTKTHWVDLAVAQDGARYMLDVGAGGIRGWDADGRLAVDFELPPAARGAQRLDVLPDGTLAVLTTDGWGFRFQGDGTVMTVWEAARLDRGASRPADIAADENGRLYVTDRGVNVVTVFEWDPAAPSAAPLTVDDGCAFDGEKSAAPAELMLGEEVEITLRVRGACAAARSGVDLAVIIDTSMSRGATRAVQAAGEQMLTLLSPGSDQVAFFGGVPSRLSGDVQLARRMMRRMQLGQADWQLLPALTATTRELYGPRGRAGAKKVIVIIMASDGIDDEAEPWQQNRARWEIEREAGQIRRRGTEVYGIWFRGGASSSTSGERLLSDVVSSARHYIDGGSKVNLQAIAARIVEQVKPSKLLTDVVITDVLPDNMIYVPGSSSPPAERSGQTLRWRLVDVPIVGTGVRYRVRPSMAGDWPTNENAFAEAKTPDGQRLRINFEIPRVLVRAAPTPNPTETSPPRPTATITATPSPEPTDSPPPAPIFLPLSLNESCAEQRPSFDVAFVIDTSTSMAGTAIEAAAAAALLFVDVMQLPDDRVAIVSFNTTADIHLALTGDRAAIVDSLTRMVEDVAAGTRIDEGLRAARIALEPLPRDDGRVPVAVLLTDGLHQGTDDAPIQLADELRDSGVEMRVVGMGSGIDEPFLTRLAGDAAAYSRAPTAAELAEIFTQLAEAFGPCPPRLFWSQR